MIKRLELMKAKIDERITELEDEMEALETKRDVIDEIIEELKADEVDVDASLLIDL